MSVRKYTALARTDFLSTAAYLKSFLASKLFLAFVLVIMFSLYRTLYAGRASVEGFTLAMLLYYVTVTEAVELSKVRVYQTISEEIKDGSCAYTLLRPLSYLSYHYCTSLAKLALNCGLVLAVGVACCFAITGPDPRAALGIVRALPAVAMAVNLNFVVMYLIGLLAFDMEEVAPVYWIFQKFVFIAGGLLMPIEFFPGWLRSAVQYLPTTYIAWFPARVAVQWDASLFLKGLIIQTGYLLLFLGIAELMFRRGMKRVQVNGG